ncbi:MAG TPA: PIN domain-containing protein [Chthoniobacterales bacterium]|nr:PIN domain-containing protein [Chthoniobacterales bacterium]
MILDTNAISAMAEQDSKIANVLGAPQEQYLSVPVLAEYRSGLIKSRYRKILEPWLDQLEQSRSILIIDAITARHYATLKDQLKSIGRMIPINDIWIAALALQHGLPLLSEDRHFDQEIIGIRRIGWR